MKHVSNKIIAVLMFTFLPGLVAAQPAPLAPEGMFTEIRAGQTAGQLDVPLAKSRLLHVDQSFREISVGSRDIADVVPLSRNMIYVLGKAYGTTNLTLRGEGGSIIAVVDVAVTYDVDMLKQRLQDLIPDESVKVTPAGDALVLSGQVSSGDHLHQILAVAERFAPGKITNMLSIGGSQQVLLEMRFAEVNRSALKNLGIQTTLENSAGASSITSDIGAVPVGSAAFGTLTGIFSSGNYNITAALGALESKGLVRTLAEPNLVALSGDTASFLAGGEFPVPVAQATNNGGPTVTVEFKPFGVGLNFTPTITGKNFVNLVMNSEVSSIDDSAAVITSGFRVPGLKVRRTKTTVELQDGQSFAIAGLLANDFSNGVGQFPWLGDLPVLGSLFRSSNYRNNTTDLVVIITVHLVQPTVAKNLAAPTDTLVLPAPIEHFGQGVIEKSNPPAGASQNNGYVLP